MRLKYQEANSKNYNKQPCGCYKDANPKCFDNDCLNRVWYKECKPGCGEFCQNQRFQRPERAPELKEQKYGGKGVGVCTKIAIEAGSFVVEYAGEVVPNEVFKDRMRTIYADDKHHYSLQLDRQRIIDCQRTIGFGKYSVNAAF